MTNRRQRRCLFPEAKTPCGRHTCVARHDRLLVFSLHHHDEEDAAFVPAAEPAHSPIINMIAQRHRRAKPKEPCLNVHGLRPHTSMASMRRHSQVKTPWRLFHVFFWATRSAPPRSQGIHKGAAAPLVGGAGGIDACQALFVGAQRAPGVGGTHPPRLALGGNGKGG
jgi:hypothetical protein